MPAHFKIQGRVNGSDGAKLTIDRTRGVATVRPHRERAEYAVTLQTLAELIVARCIRQRMADEGLAVPTRRKERS